MRTLCGIRAYPGGPTLSQLVGVIRQGRGQILDPLRITGIDQNIHQQRNCLTVHTHLVHHQRVEYPQTGIIGVALLPLHQNLCRLKIPPLAPQTRGPPEDRVAVFMRGQTEFDSPGKPADCVTVIVHSHARQPQLIRHTCIIRTLFMNCQEHVKSLAMVAERAVVNSLFHCHNLYSMHTCSHY